MSAAKGNTYAVKPKSQLQEKLHSRPVPNFRFCWKGIHKRFEKFSNCYQCKKGV